MSTIRKPTRSFIAGRAAEPAQASHDDVAAQAVKSLVDLSWDASAGALANFHELSDLQTRSLTNIHDIFFKAALDAANSRDIQGLLRVNVDLGAAIVAEAAAFGRELLDRMIAAQRVAACSAMAWSGVTGSGPDGSPERVADPQSASVLEHLQQEVERDATASQSVVRRRPRSARSAAH